MSKVILISQKPLPYHEIGSWTTMYKNYFETGKSNIDIIICEAPQTKFNNVEYCIVPNTTSTKIKRRFSKNPYQVYIDTLVKCLKFREKYVIQIVDNFGLAKALCDFLEDDLQLRSRLFIQFFYHGYPPFFGNFESRWFFEFIDEMVLLTHSSYIEHKEAYTILPCLFSVLHNGIDAEKFFRASEDEKRKLKQKHQVEDNTVFLWCSQDRSKKGLDLILYVWKMLLKKHNNIELWVIGAQRDIQLNHVKFFGKLPNDKLPEYYQTSDCYLFPVLNHEGFGLTLIEALNCGNYCIASALGGVPEVLQYGKIGKLIENPHFIDDWIIAVEDFLKHKHVFKNKQTQLYTVENWMKNMNTIILNAKQLLE